MRWAACCGKNQRRHLVLSRDRRRGAGPDAGPAAAAHAVTTSGSRPPCPPSSRCPWSVTTTIVQFSAGPEGRHLELTAATSRPTRWSAARRAAR